MRQTGSVCLAFGMASVLLCACSRGIEVDTALLGERDVIVLESAIRPSAPVTSNAASRSDLAAGGALAGAGAGASIWFYDPQALAIAVVAPVVIPATALAGAAVGGAVGAAAGTSYSRETIEQSVAVLQSRFRPEAHQTRFSNAIAEALRTRMSGRDGVCVTQQSRRPSCPETSKKAELQIATAMSLVPASSGGTAGGMDLVVAISTTARPSGLFRPSCVGWMHRSSIGHVVDLARKNGNVAQSRVAAKLPEIASEYVRLLLPPTEALPIPPAKEGARTGPTPINESQLRVYSANKYMRRRLEKGEFVLETRNDRRWNKPPKIGKASGNWHAYSCVRR